MPLDLTGGQQPGYPGRGAGEWPDLSDVLLAGENVSFIGRARVTSSHFPRLGRWLVVVTDRRLICVRDARRGARQHVARAARRRGPRGVTWPSRWCAAPGAAGSGIAGLDAPALWTYPLARRISEQGRG